MNSDKTITATFTGVTGRVPPWKSCFTVTIYAAAVAFPLSASAQSVTFGPVVNYTLLSDPHQVRFGDLDGDSYNDLAVAVDVSGVVAVMLNDQLGNFPVIRLFNTGGSLPKAVSIGDVDDDGDIDVVAPNWGSNTVSVLLNDGYANFTLDQTYLVGNRPRWVEIAELNGAPGLDLVVVNEPGGFSILFNKGNADGKFHPAVSYTSGFPLHAVVADIDGDGDNDIAAANGEGLHKVSIHKNDGFGGFSLGQEIDIEPFPLEMAAGEIDGMPGIDLVVGYPGAGRYSVLLNDGSGNFADNPPSFPAGGGGIHGIALADLNGDTVLDLIIANTDSDQVALFLNLNNGLGQFAPLPELVINVGNQPRDVALGDLDNDGLLDLATANALVGDTVSVVLNETACPCDLFATTAFEPPMGKKKKIGSTLPIKFRLFSDGVEIVSQAQLNQILEDNGCMPGCPRLLVYLEDDVIGLPLDNVDDNVGDPDEGDCFRYSAPNWIYNVRLLPPGFMPHSCYSVEIEVGDCVLVPDNNVFETK